MVSIILVLNRNSSSQKLREGSDRIAKPGVASVRQDRTNNEVGIQTTAAPERQIRGGDSSDRTFCSIERHNSSLDSCCLSALNNRTRRRPGTGTNRAAPVSRSATAFCANRDSRNA